MLPTQPETIGGAKKVEREERAKTQVRYLVARIKGLIETLFSHSETSVVFDSRWRCRRIETFGQGSSVRLPW